VQRQLPGRLQDLGLAPLQAEMGLGRWKNVQFRTRPPCTRAGTPGLLAAIALGQLSNLMGCLTTYGIGSAPPYFGAGYVSQAKWYQLGLLLSFVYLGVWLGIGGAWWKVIGLW
jgi:hypothetical protein